MKRALLSVLAALTLSLPADAQAPVSAPPIADSAFPAVVRGVPIAYVMAAPGEVNDPKTGERFAGRARFVGGVCVVELDAGEALWNPEWATVTIWHEVAHCLDFASGFTHFGWRDGDACELGPYYCRAAEGFAQTYALAAIRACGESLYPLGFRGDSRLTRCKEAPDPALVKPPAR